MAIADFYGSGQHQSNLGHFAALVKLALADKAINRQEEAVLKRLAFKLDVPEDDYKKVIKDPNTYPLLPPYDLETRIERIHDLFGIIYADHEIDEAEKKLIHKYAMALGFSEQMANEEIQKCMRFFGKDIDLED